MLTKSEWQAFCSQLQIPLKLYLPAHIDCSHSGAQLITNSTWHYLSDQDDLEPRIVCQIPLALDQDKLAYDFQVTVDLDVDLEARLVVGSVILDRASLKDKCKLLPVPIPFQHDLCHQSSQVRLELVSVLGDPMTMPLPSRILIEYQLLYMTAEQADQVRSSTILFDHVAYKQGRIVPL